MYKNSKKITEAFDFNEVAKKRVSNDTIINNNIAKSNIQKAKELIIRECNQEFNDLFKKHSLYINFYTESKEKLISNNINWMIYKSSDSTSQNELYVPQYDAETDTFTMYILCDMLIAILNADGYYEFISSIKDILNKFKSITCKEQKINIQKSYKVNKNLSTITFKCYAAEYSILDKGILLDDIFEFSATTYCTFNNISLSNLKGLMPLRNLDINNGNLDSYIGNQGFETLELNNTTLPESWAGLPDNCKMIQLTFSLYNNIYKSSILHNNIDNLKNVIKYGPFMDFSDFNISFISNNGKIYISNALYYDTSGNITDICKSSPEYYDQKMQNNIFNRIWQTAKNPEEQHLLLRYFKEYLYISSPKNTQQIKNKRIYI